MDTIAFVERLFHSFIVLGKKLYLYKLVLTDGLMMLAIFKAVMVTC